MNYHEPRQVNPDSGRPDAGKWRYTNMNDGRIWPEGYCAEGCPGHDTKDGAYEHQTQYMLDHARYDGRMGDVRRKCEAEGCEEWTDAFAQVGHLQMFVLCDEHRTRGVVAGLYGTCGDSFGSW